LIIIDALTLYARSAARIFNDNALVADAQLINGTLVHSYASNTKFNGVSRSDRFHHCDEVYKITQVYLARLSWTATPSDCRRTSSP
jgi:hypothetical protein